MSLINQMLQDLEQRRADAGPAVARVRAVPRSSAAGTVIRWTAGALVLAAVAAGGGYWFAGGRDAAKPVAPPVPTAPPVAAPRPLAPVPQPPPADLPSVLQLSSALAQLPRETPPAPSAAPERAEKAPRAERPEKAPAAPVPPVRVKQPEALPMAAGGEEDIKRVSPQQRAENAYRQAYNNLQRGRLGEAEDGLRLALQAEPRHAASRQALAVLLVETGHLQQAEQVLRQGLELQPDNLGFAMTLARIQVERGDTATALATLQHHPDDSAEYHGFLAALLERTERHKEAVEHYQAALRLRPDAGSWWLGLGISLQADNQPAKAAEAFRRARQSAGLSPELRAFAEQRLKQLQ